MTAIPTGSQQRKTRTVKNVTTVITITDNCQKIMAGHACCGDATISIVARSTHRNYNFSDSAAERKDTAGRRGQALGVTRDAPCVQSQSPKVRARVSRAHAWHVLLVQSGPSFAAVVWWRNFNRSSRQKLTGENQSFVTRDIHTKGTASLIRELKTCADFQGNTFFVQATDGQIIYQQAMMNGNLSTCLVSGNQFWSALKNTTETRQRDHSVHLWPYVGVLSDCLLLERFTLKLRACFVFCDQKQHFNFNLLRVLILFQDTSSQLISDSLCLSLSPH